MERDKWQSLFAFWDSFGVPAFEQSSVGIEDRAPNFPYITYEAIDGEFGADVYASASIWTRSASWAEADRIYHMVNNGLPAIVDYDYDFARGIIWITKDDSFARNMGDESDSMIKRKLLTVVYHFA